MGPYLGVDFSNVGVSGRRPSGSGHRFDVARWPAVSIGFEGDVLDDGEEKRRGIRHAEVAAPGDFE
jgi:hypothetical protein